MIANLVLGIIAVLLCLLVNDKKIALRWSFFLITLFLSVRYGWGNDYLEYLKTYSELSDYSFGLFDIERSSDLYRNNEFGWVILNRLFSILGLGFFGMIIVLTIFENWTLHRIVEKYVDPQYYWVAVLFYVFSSDFCVYYSMMRQFLCISLYLIVVDLMIEKRAKGYLLWSVGIILLGSTIHHSNIVMLLTLPLFYVKLGTGRHTAKWVVFFSGVFALWSVFGRDLVENSLLTFLENSDEFYSYTYYLDWEGTKANTGLGVVFRYIMFVVWLLLLLKVEKKQQIIVLLGLISYFLEVIIDIVPMASRFALYFSVMDMIRWAWLFALGKKYPILYTFFMAELVILTKTFLDFYHNPIWFERCFEFHTIFEASHWM